MSDDRKKTFSLDGGKYEIDRNQAGQMTEVRRHGEPWPAGFEQLRFMGVVHAMLDRIEALEATLDRQQLSYEREREIDQAEIERLIALRRDDANTIRILADALKLPTHNRLNDDIVRAISRA